MDDARVATRKIAAWADAMDEGWVDRLDQLLATTQAYTAEICGLLDRSREHELGVARAAAEAQVEFRKIAAAMRRESTLLTDALQSLVGDMQNAAAEQRQQLATLADRSGWERWWTATRAGGIAGVLAGLVCGALVATAGSLVLAHLSLAAP